ncbi:hypothetical protein [Sphingomonas sp. PAMC 26617]|uniref:hypothetical protein n=1 Tax=Sphingomonas sp. PAMC 26617 TaxID=1112216 RepID=UPI0002891DBD|nr:hypothetical protein [Sphingomonas sp. PAMC 26617]
MASALIGAGASILGGITGGKGAQRAAQQQAKAQQASLAETQRQFNITQQNFAPYQAAGTQALGGVQDLTGLNGNGAQQTAIDALKASPGFQSLFNQGADTILQNGAATGGLRGGNMQSSLANFGANTLATTIQQQLANLGGLVSTGAGATGQMAGASQAYSGQQAQTQSLLGNANASASAIPYAALQGIVSQLGGQFSKPSLNSLLSQGNGSPAPVKLW